MPSLKDLLQSWTVVLSYQVTIAKLLFPMKLLVLSFLVCFVLIFANMLGIFFLCLIPLFIFVQSFVHWICSLTLYVFCTDLSETRWWPSFLLENLQRFKWLIPYSFCNKGHFTPNHCPQCFYIKSYSTLTYCPYKGQPRYFLLTFEEGYLYHSLELIFWCLKWL